jgi:hypothetical protein
MTFTNKNTPVLHRKEFQLMTPPPSAAAGNVFVVEDKSGLNDYALYFVNQTTHYLYSHKNDSFFQIPSGAMTAIAAGACGFYHPWSNTFTANGGSTTTVTVNSATFNLNGIVVNNVIEFISSGTNFGLRRTITAINHVAPNATGDIILTLDSALPTAVLNTHTFRIRSGRFFVICGTNLTTAGSFKSFDLATMSWSAALSGTGLPTSFGTDGALTGAYIANNVLATGTATSGGATTLVNSGKSWTTNQWTNYQVRITSGTGIGQVRTISSNTGTTLTVSTSWSINPDATSVYDIEGNEDFLYLLGNGAVTMYRYSISGNSWTTLSPSVARAGNTGLGTCALVPYKTGDANWGNESTIKDSRYIYSLRGGATATIDVYDIALNSWSVITYNNTETFTSGSGAAFSGKWLYLRKDATNRFFRYSMTENFLEGFAVNLFTDGTAVVGAKMWTYKLSGSTDIEWVYAFGNNSAWLHRILVI